MIVAATPIEPPDGDFCWAFHFVNDSAELIEELIIEGINYEWGDAGSSRTTGQVFGPLAPGEWIEFLREAATEVRTSLTLRVRGPFGERVIEAEAGRLYRGGGILVPIPILGRRGKLTTLKIRSVDSPSTIAPIHHRR
jgi:hypothetical protein